MLINGNLILKRNKPATKMNSFQTEWKN